LLRPIEREGGDDGVPSDFQDSFKVYDIRSTVKLLGEEVERRSIMPKVERLQGLFAYSVR
jgi:hypothetical protein